MLNKILLAGAALVFASQVAAAKDLKAIGISLGSLGNPFFIALSKGAQFEARQINPNVKITTVGFDYDLGKQNTQIDNFIAAFLMARLAVQQGAKLLQGEKLDKDVTLMDSKLITRENVGDYKGWTSAHE